MEEEGTKTCPNCKREIPSRNYDIHTVHCARNIKLCHVCKEPVPLGELNDHHDKLHKLLPCKECGERICGTDLEDHVRDSCAHTMKSCRFCDLDLRRGELPGHERYCGSRTEQCADCGEWVMHRYKQLHVDSNHGFLRLDDDPEPIKKTNIVKPSGNRLTNGTAYGKIVNQEPSTSKNTNLNCMQREFGQPICQRPSQTPGPTTRDRTIENDIRPGTSNGAIPRVKRTNDQPQVNRAGEAPDKVLKNLWSRGTVKKRPAPPPPVAGGLPAQCAQQRREREERERAEQTAINLAQGLPPVLSAAEKLDKLRKMDALRNREIEDKNYKNILQGRVWKTPDVYAGNVLGRAPIDQSELARQRDSLKNFVPMTPEEFGERFRTLQLRGERGGRAEGEQGGGAESGACGGGADGGASGVEGGASGGGASGVEAEDRFSQIKSSLRELRRGLNEVTAPYNQNPAPEVKIARGRRPTAQALSQARARAGAGAVAGAVVGPGTDDGAGAVVGPGADAVAGAVVGPGTDDGAGAVVGPGADAVAGAVVGPGVVVGAGADEDVALPCEFCAELVPLDDLVIHQTGCRPDLAQLRPVEAPRWPTSVSSNDVTVANVNADVTATADVTSGGAGEAVIPCEFCTQSLPIELITEHQVRCERESRLLFPD